MRAQTGPKKLRVTKVTQLSVYQSRETQVHVCLAQSQWLQGILETLKQCSLESTLCSSLQDLGPRVTWCHIRGYQRCTWKYVPLLQWVHLHIIDSLPCLFAEEERVEECLMGTMYLSSRFPCPSAPLPQGVALSFLLPLLSLSHSGLVSVASKDIICAW